MIEYALQVEPLGILNGKMRFVVEALAEDDRRVLHSDTLDVRSARSRKSFSRCLADRIRIDDDGPVEGIVRSIDEDLLALIPAAEQKAIQQKQPKSLIPPHVSILGCTPEGSVFIFSRDTGRLWEFAKLRDLDKPTYLMIAGQWAADNVADQHIGRVRDEIALAARGTTLTQKPRGQGIHCATNGRLLLVDGNRSVLFRRHGLNEAAEIQQIDDPIVDGKLLRLVPGAEWIPLDEVLKLASDMSAAQALVVWSRVQDAISTWSFTHHEDRCVVAGLIIATVIQAVLSFRPHLWMYGGTNSGKTALLTLLKWLFPWALSVDDETTEAALRQSIRDDVLPVLIDEFENSRHRRAVIKLLRTSTRGGKIRKGTVGHKPVEFGLRHIVWVASIERGLQRAADRNRYASVEIVKPDNSIDGNHLRLPDEDSMRALGIDLVALSLCLALDINDRAKRYGRFRYQGIDRRLVEVYATPVAVWAAIRNANDEEAEDYLAAVLEGREGATIEASDADEAGLIESILTATLRVDVDDADGIRSDESKTVYRELSVAQILETNETSGELLVLAAHGAKPDRDQGVHGMFVHPPTVCRKLLTGTPWADLNITDILKRAEGAKVCNRRLAGRQAKGIWVPLPEDESDTDVHNE